jgi:S-adenosylmethionine:tRNA ribosyltransferase-isomerase
VLRARADGGRVVAIGTSTARALEANALAHGGLVAACGVASLRIGPGHALRVVDGILSGMHEAGSSHFDLLSAFAPRTLLSLAWSHAEDERYLGEEFGDAMLVLGY